MIDLENCPGQIQQLMNNLQQYSQIVICYALSGAKVPLDWIVPLTAVVQTNRLHIVKMANGGKNSADFGITFWAGLLMAKSPADAHFDILSDDADLDHVVALLHEHQCSANRIRTQKENSPEISTVIKSSTATQEYCLHLNTHQKKPPGQKRNAAQPHQKQI